MTKRTLGGLLGIALMGGLSSTLSHACVVPATPPPGGEIEIETEFEDYDSHRNRVRYKVEIEVELFSPTGLSSVQCQCGLGLGSSTVPAPDSFAITAAAVGIKRDTGEGEDFTPFSGFVADPSVESDFEGLPSFPAGAKPSGFSVDVSAFSLPPLNPGDIFVLAFEMEFAPGDFNKVNGNAIQFAAGSADPGHELNILSGYQTRLSLPAFVIPEPASMALLSGLGLAALAGRKRRK